MSKYMNQLYNRNKNLQSKVELQKTSSSCKPVDSCNNEFKGEGDSVVADPNIVENAGTNWCSLTCRSIRIGNYKVLPKDKITITEKGVQIKVPSIINPSEVVTLNIVTKDILKVLVHFGKQMPLLFLYISPSACLKTRKLLKMTNSQSFYLDVQSSDETQKRITILPDKLLEENKVTLNQHFSTIIQTLESKDANEILVRSSPKDIQKMKEKMTGGQATAVTDKRAGDSGAPGPVVKFCQYPPDMAGNVSVTNEDYSCLEAEQFLNDVIIDFYLKYLQHGKFSSIEAVKDRTHIFTTYFYKRLTTRPQYGKGKTHPVEDNQNLTAAEKRYDRVERWTKKVNLFEKDFIVVPINEHAHWFVCVICFPGQIGCVNADTGEGCEAPASQSRARGNRVKRKTVKKPMTIGSTTITRVIPGSNMREDIKFLEDDGSDRDEAEASDDDIEDDDEEAAVKRTEEEVAAKLAVRQPCILTFDSLAGSSKARTHQTLREYLACEWKKKMVTQGKEERAFNKDTMPGGSPRVQQQPNFSDCGIYLLQYIESFFKDPIKDYTLPIRSLGAWFTKDEVEGKRDNIASLIRTLAASQNPGKEFKYPQLNFFNAPEEESEEEDDEDYEDPLRGASSRPSPGYVQISSSGGPVPQQVRVANDSPVVVTPGKGKVLLQRTGGPGGALKMSPYTSTMVPAGVTVTPAAPGPPIRQLSGNNIQIRKMAPVPDPIQTSPDSTSQEPESMEVNGGGQRMEAEEDGVSQSSQETGVNGVKRTAEAMGGGCDNKRIKSDSES